MARTPASNYSSPGYQYATADADGFDRLDVAGQGQSLDGHDHSSGKGLPIAASALADGSVTNAKLASDTARANLLTNGSFEIWQRGNGAFTAATLYMCDRWYSGLGAGSTLSVSRETTNTDQSGSAAVCTYVHGADSSFQQKLEDFSQLKGRTVSLSVRVRTSTGSALRAAIYDSVNSWRTGSFAVGTGAYETITFTAAIAAAATDVRVGVFFQASCTAYLDNAMLVVGSVPADYAPLHPADDLARCLRYYEALAPNTPMLVGQATTTLGAYVPYAWQVAKAVIPTVTLSAPASWSLSSATATGALVATAVSVTVQTVASCLLGIAVASGTVAGNAVIVQAASAGQFANVEANP
jgi:hypothetical protein